MTEVKRKILRGQFLAVFFVPIVIAIGFLCLYIGTQTVSVYGGDSGELVAAAYTVGIAHPPGYPLYAMLGAIVSRVIPFGTIAWRVGFLSSVPMALSIFFVWLIVYRLTKSMLSSTLSSLIYGFLYPVWLYAVVPEVFGMYAFFSALFVYLMVIWIEDQKVRTLLSLAFITGLAFTHHHLILLGIVAGAITQYRFFKKSFSGLRVRLRDLFLLFVLGLAPYLYAPIASFFHPLFDSEHASTIAGFLRLVTRASYGTFRASSVGTGGIFNGLADLATFGDYLFHDLSVVGIIFALAGLYYLKDKDKRIFFFFFLYLALLLFYFFYAGFPVVNNLYIGTLERFFIVPYQMVVILFGVGAAFFYKKLSTLTRLPFIPLIFYAFLALLPLGAFRSQYRQFIALRTDVTLENYTDDVLQSIPTGSVYGAYEDTTVSSIDYAIYVQNKRPDIMYVSFPMLGRSYYRKELQRRYPALLLPEWGAKTTITEYLTTFLGENAKKFTITSDISFSDIPGYFVPVGLVYIYYPALSDIPDRSLIFEKNDNLWKQFSDPKGGVLGQYEHLLLSDILRPYAVHSLALAQAYIASGKYKEASPYISYAVSLETSVRAEAYSSIFDAFLKRDQCSFARSMVDLIHEKWGDDFVILEQYHRLFDTCKSKDPKGLDMEKRYQKLKPTYDASIQ